MAEARVDGDGAFWNEDAFQRQVLESLPGMVFTTRADGYCDYQSQQWVDYTGVAMEEMVGDGWNRLLHPDDRERAYRVWREAVEGRGPYELEYRVRRRDGVYEWFRVIGRPIRDEAGRIVRWFGVALNIEELKRSEEALRESEGRVRHKIESVLSPEGDLGELELADLVDAASLQSLMEDFYALALIPMAIIDVKGRVLVGVGWQEICTCYHRQQPETLRHCLESDTQLTEGVPAGEIRLYKCKNHMWDIATPIIVGGRRLGNIFSGQFFFEGEEVDREFFRSQARRYGFNEEGYLGALDRVPRLSREAVDRGMAFLAKLAGMLSQLGYSNAKQARLLGERERLASSLRASEEEARWLARFPEENPNPVLRVGSDGAVQYCNAAAAAAMGGQCELGRPLGLEELMRLVREALAGDKPIEGDVRLGEADYWMSVTPIGREGYANIYGRDVSARKRAERALEAARDELEERVRERTAELERRSGQLRALAGELSAAEDRERRRLAEVLHEDLQQMLVAIRYQVSRAARKMEQGVCDSSMLEQLDTLVLDAVAQCRSLSHELSPPTLRQQGLISALVWQSERMRSLHGIRVELELAEEAEPGSESLKAFLFRAARELLLNAAKHAGVREVQVRLRRVGGDIEMTVSDRGLGFTAAEQWASSRGFGLMTIRERAELLGGGLEVRTEAGQGSSFTVRVPDEVAGAGGALELRPLVGQESREAEGGGQAVASEVLRVVLVDDHRSMRTGLARLLEDEPDLKVVGEASDGETAVGLVKELRPDVVVMDVSLPVIDGMEATRRIKSFCPGVRVVGLSMYEEGDVVRGMLAAGASAYVRKSDPSGTLLEAIRGGK